MLADLGLSLRGRPAVTVSAPAEVFVGAESALVLELTRPVAGLACAVDWPAILSAPAELHLPAARIHPIPFRATHRGLWRIERVWLRWPSRLRLFDIVPRLRTDLGGRTVPDIRPAQSGQIAVQVQSELFGLKENTLIGEGSEFHQLRDFVPGMDIRSVDWKHSAKVRRLVVKDMRAERNHNVIVCIDNGRLMRERIGGLPKVDHAINAGLAIAWAAALGGDRVGLFTYDARPRLFFPPQPGRLAFARLRTLSAEIDYATIEANHTLALAELNARTPRRSLLVIFSDFVDTTTAALLVENVSVLARRHAMIFVALSDPDLPRWAALAPRSLDDVALAVSAGQAVAERRQVMEQLARLGVTVVDVPPEAVTARVVSAYLNLKAREVL